NTIMVFGHVGFFACAAAGWLLPRVIDSIDKLPGTVPARDISLSSTVDSHMPRFHRFPSSGGLHTQTEADRAVSNVGTNPRVPDKVP
ncbi:MAG: hypothetical protein ACXWPK_10815, partial [Isosphaeraceae bacterium]